MDNKLVVLLANHIFHRKMYNVADWKITKIEIERDGRKQPSVLKTLFNEGYITQHASDAYVNLTNLAWGQIQAVKPDLFASWSRKGGPNEYRNAPAYVRMDDLGLSEKKYVMENLADYTLYAGYANYHNQNVVPYKPGDKTTGDDFFVGSKELEQAVKTHLRDEQVKTAYKQSLGYGLRHLDILPADDAKAVETGKTLPFGAEAYLTYGLDPAKWEQETQDKIKGVLEEMESLQKNLRILVGIQTGVYNFGGWQKFLADYRQLVERAVDKANVPDSQSGTE